MTHKSWQCDQPQLTPLGCTPCSTYSTHYSTLWAQSAWLLIYVLLVRFFLNRADPEEHIAFSKDCLAAVLEAYPSIVARHKDEEYTEQQKEWQLMRRGR